MARIAAISVYVTDLESALGFYQGLIGLKEVERPTPEQIVLVTDEGPAVVLCQASARANARYAESAATVIGFMSADVAKDLDKLRKAGATLLFDAPQEFPGGKFIVAMDPSGNAVELLQFEG